MKIAIIGRSELLYNTIELLLEKGYEIPLIITSKEAPEYKKTSADYENLALKINATYILTSKINSEDTMSQIKSLGLIDIAVSVNYSSVISKEIIDLFPLGILNAHAGDLPRFRGNACQAWAIINGEDSVGLCIHRMIGGELDSGDIIVKSYLPININTRIAKTFDWIENEIPKLILNAIIKISKAPTSFEVQSKNPEDALRTYPRIPSDGKINWNLSSESIVRLINASSEPFSGAFTIYDEEKLIIWRGKLYDDNENYLAIPGQISKIDKNSGSIVVITGDGKIEIDEIEINRERGKPSNFIKSIRKRFN